MFLNLMELTRQGDRTARFALSSTLNIPNTHALWETYVFSHNPDFLPFHPEQDTVDSSKCSSKKWKLKKGTTSHLPFFSSQKVPHMFYYKSNYEMTRNLTWKKKEVPWKQ